MTDSIGHPFVGNDPPDPFPPDTNPDANSTISPDNSCNKNDQNRTITDDDMDFYDLNHPDNPSNPHYHETPAASAKDTPKHKTTDTNASAHNLAMDGDIQMNMTTTMPDNRPHQLLRDHDNVMLVDPTLGRNDSPDDTTLFANKDTPGQITRHSSTTARQFDQLSYSTESEWNSSPWTTISYKKKTTNTHSLEPIDTPVSPRPDNRTTNNGSDFFSGHGDPLANTTTTALTASVPDADTATKASIEANNHEAARGSTNTNNTTNTVNAIADAKSTDNTPDETNKNEHATNNNDTTTAPDPTTPQNDLWPVAH